MNALTTKLLERPSWQKKLNYVYKATKQHSLNLAKFVTIYKSTLLLQKLLANNKPRKFDTFFAGLLGGWLVFGERNAVNEQVNHHFSISTFNPFKNTNFQLTTTIIDCTLCRISSSHFFPSPSRSSSTSNRSRSRCSLSPRCSLS
jgi:hypothetical protein